MPGSTNFQQFNPPQANQESDAVYTADAQRAGGITSGAIIPSAMINKVFYQHSTMIAALATALVNKGYSPSDANLGNLVAVLANLVTQADLAASPALGGAPTAATPGTTDNSARIATTSYLKTGFQSVFSGSTGYVRFPDCIGGLIIQFGKTAGAVGVSLINLPLAFPNFGVAAFAQAISPGYTIGSYIPNLTQLGVNPSAPVQMNWLVLGY